MSTLYAVRCGDLKIIVRAASPDAAGDAFWRETERRGAPSVHSWIVEAWDLTAEQVAECEHVVEADEARDLAARWLWWRTGGPEGLPKPKTTDQLHANVKRMTKMCVTTEDQARLYAWVRAQMDGAVPIKVFLAEMVGRALGWGNDGREPVTGTGDAPVEMEAWFADAWALCEAAGWPT